MAYAFYQKQRRVRSGVSLFSSKSRLRTFFGGGQDKGKQYNLLEQLHTSEISCFVKFKAQLSTKEVFRQPRPEFLGHKGIRMLCGQSDFGNQKSEIGTISESILDFSLQKSTNRIFISENLDCTNGKHIIEQQRIQKPEIRKKKSENKQITQFCGQTVVSY